VSGEDSMLLKGKTAMVTGGGSGLGQASAYAFGREGARVAIFDNNTEAAKQTADELIAQGREAMFVVGDVSREADVRTGVAEIFSSFGRIDILFNNAGVAVRQSVTEQDETGWDRCMAVNLKGVFLCSKHVIPHMLNRGGSVINMSSVTGIVGVRNRSAYSASKGAIAALTRNMALDYARFGIRVNCVCPGFTTTPLINALLRDPEKKSRLIGTHPLGRLGTPEDIANAVVFLASDLSSWITGQALAVDGGFGVGAYEDI
jgi:NAD(P)-dependent dehydrogenase (short-subunit alcohol dehydrogenase family)